MLRELSKSSRTIRAAMIIVILAASFIYAIPTSFIMRDLRDGVHSDGLIAVLPEFAPMYALALVGTLSPLIGTLLGVAFGAHEYRPRTIETSLVAGGGWLRLVCSKLGALLLGMVACVMLASIACLAIALVCDRVLQDQVWDDVSLPVAQMTSFAEYCRAVISVVLGLALWAAFGFALGSTTRSTFTGAVVAIGWVLIEAFWVARWLPGTAQAALLESVAFVPGRYSAVYAPRGLGLSWTFGLWASSGWIVIFLLLTLADWAWKFRDARLVGAASSPSVPEAPADL